MFNLLKAHLTSAPVLGYLDFSDPFELEMDASLQGLGAVLSQMDEQCCSKVISYVNRSQSPNEKKMRNYSSAKLELLLLEWAVMEKLWDYLKGPKCTMYMDNNPLVYVRESKLGAAEIKLLNEHVLLDFDIKFRTGRS